jgi:site-specific recombinase XerD
MTRRKTNSRAVPLVEKFIAVLQPTRSEQTCRTYTNQLRAFHRWLKMNRVQLNALNRRHLTRWLMYLSKQGLKAATRNNHIVTVRLYLRWLVEQGIIKLNADELIRRTDLPKLPKYLPRPLAPQADRQLQKRLRNSQNPLHKGLVLMRRTGLRIGELIRLQFDCMRTDQQGTKFLKVPLGKLYNERLVPLDDISVKLIKNLRRKGNPSRQFLMVTARGKRTRYNQYVCALNEICRGLHITDKMTTHRLRHTYATSLLSAGMSLTSVMKLLGHRDYRMTLRYAEITQEAVGKEYFEALAEIEKRYQSKFCAGPTDAFDPVKAITNVIRWLKKDTVADESYKSIVRSVSKRLDRAKQDIAILCDRKK